MTATLDIAGDEDRPLLAALLAHAFAFPIADTETWYARAGRDNVLVYRDPRGLVGGLITIPMGQMLGGRSVPMMGLAGVGVAPEHRSGGTGAAMMTAALRLARARGAAISTLYPSTVPFYQRVGYERAGARFRLVVDARDLADAGRGAPDDVVIAPVSLDPDEEVTALQRRLAAGSHGALDRGTYVWQRTVRPWRSDPLAFAARRHGRVVGHVVVIHRMVDTCDTSLEVADACAEDAGAARSILAFLGGYRSLVGKVGWNVHVPGLFQALLPDRRASLAIADLWMLRVLDVEKALVARGFPRAARGAVDLAYEDDVLPELSGSFALRVEGGRATVTRGGSGAARIGPRGMAALLTGFTTARELVQRELLAATDEVVDTLDGLFAGPLPTMTEMF